MKKRGKRTLAGAIALTASGLGACIEAVQPLTDSTKCSEIGTNYCALAAVPQSDVTDPKPERAMPERKRIEGTTDVTVALTGQSAGFTTGILTPVVI